MDHNEAIRDARKLGLPKMLILGVQHLFAMFGATILVPILVLRKMLFSASSLVQVLF